MKIISPQPKKVLSNRKLFAKLEEGASSFNFKGKKILVICEDVTRGTPVRMFFNHLLEFLFQQAKDITILFALGTHRPMTENEMLGKLGITPQTARNLRLLNHNAFDNSKLTQIGIIDDIPLKLNKSIVENDILIGISNTLPHRVTGFSGGAKLLCPGIAGREIIDYTHWYSTLFPEKEIVGKINNPVRQILDKVPQLLQERFDLQCISINCVATPSSIIDIFIGDFYSSYRKAAQLSKEVFFRVVKPCSGILALLNKESLDFWQGAKAVYNCARVIENGGLLVVYGEFKEGISPVHGKTIKKFGYSTPQRIRKLVHSGKLSNILVASHMIRVSQYLEKVKISLSSENLTEDECRKVGLGFVPPQRIKEMKFDYIVVNPTNIILTNSR